MVEISSLAIANTNISLAAILAICQVILIVSARCKQFNINTHIQKAVPEKVKITTKYDIKTFKVKKKNEFEVSLDDRSKL